MRRNEIDLNGVILTAAMDAARTDATYALAVLKEARSLVDDLTADYVKQARKEGRSWAQVGVVLGISKQAAHERFGS